MILFMTRVSQRFSLPADGCVVVVEYDSECVAGGGPDLAFEGRQQRKDHVDAERLFVSESIFEHIHQPVLNGTHFKLLSRGVVKTSTLHIEKVNQDEA